MRYINNKGWGDPWHSPLWLFTYPHNSSTTLWLLHSTIELGLPLCKMLHTIYTCTHVRQNGLRKPCKTLRLRQLREDQLFDILMMVDDGEMMPSLVVYDGVCMLKGDILLKANTYLHCIWYTDMDPLSNSSDNMHIIILSAARLPTYWCIVSVLMSKCV